MAMVGNDGEGDSTPFSTVMATAEGFTSFARADSRCSAKLFGGEVVTGIHAALFRFCPSPRHKNRRRPAGSPSRKALVGPSKRNTILPAPLAEGCSL
jgi:hypothetical protein